MTTIVGARALASAAARAANRSPADLNPLLRAAIPPAPAGQALDARVLAETPDARELLVRHVTSPVALVLGTHAAGRTERTRLGLDPIRPTVERLHEDGSSWEDATPQQLLETLTSALPHDPVLLAPARLTQETRSSRLGLPASPREHVRRALAQAAAPAAAFARLDDLDPDLREALLTTGPRISLSWCLHDPRRAAARELWTRLWVSGPRHLFRTTPVAEGDVLVTPVPPGDVLGSIEAVLEHGLRVAASLPASAGAR